jgi:hypothetical protein
LESILPWLEKLVKMGFVKRLLVTGRPWEDAIEYCEALEFAVYDDWRLPNMNELISLLDINYSSAFENPLSLLWSSTTFILNPDTAWMMKLHSRPYSSNNFKTESYLFRAVRSGS